MHFVNIQGQCRSEMYAIRWLFTCRVMAHEASRSNAYALIDHYWPNPLLAQ
jgi:hypothetical protein